MTTHLGVFRRHLNVVFWRVEESDGLGGLCAHTVKVLGYCRGHFFGVAP